MENKYLRRIKVIPVGQTVPVNVDIDFYTVMRAFNTGSAAIDHAVKKCLCPGKRGIKDRKTDIKEAILSLKRELDELEIEGYLNGFSEKEKQYSKRSFTHNPITGETKEVTLVPTEDSPEEAFLKLYLKGLCE